MTSHQAGDRCNPVLDFGFVLIIKASSIDYFPRTINDQATDDKINDEFDIDTPGLIPPEQLISGLAPCS